MTRPSILASEAVSQPLMISTQAIAMVASAAQARAQRRPSAGRCPTSRSTPMCSPRRRTWAAASITTATSAKPTTSSTQTGASLKT